MMGLTVSIGLGDCRLHDSHRGKHTAVRVVSHIHICRFSNQIIGSFLCLRSKKYTSCGMCNTQAEFNLLKYLIDI